MCEISGVTKEIKLLHQWEDHPEEFLEITRTEFDRFTEEQSFAVGPLVEERTDWDIDFGPTCPYRHMVGQLVSGRLVFAEFLDLPGCPA